MSAREQRVRSLIAQDAADWFVASRAGLTATQREDFATWLKASPVHVEEYLALEVMGRDLRAACEASQNSIDALLQRARLAEDAPVRPFWPRSVESPRTSWPRWQAAAFAMAALGVMSVGLLWLGKMRPLAPVLIPAPGVTAQHFETRHGEQQTHNLADGSVLHLNTDTKVTVRYSKTERLVMLTSGEVEFEVAHTPGRSFRVLAGPAAVVDLGTRFDVRLEDGSTRVTVVEGRVAVGLSRATEVRGTDSGPGAAPVVYLSANQQLLVAGEGWPATPSSVDAQRATAWLRRQIMFENEPLERVASEFNRYASKPIEISTPELRDLQISGVFATDNNAAFIAFLRSLDGVRVEVTDERIVVSHK